MIRIQLIVLAVVGLVTAPALVAQATPQELGDRMARSIRSSDAGALDALIHPEVRRTLPERRIQRAVRSWLNQDIGETWSVDVMPAAEVDNYDPTTSIYDLGGLKLRFSVEPTHFIQLVVEEEITVRSGGEPRRVQARSDLTIDGIRRENGRWWVVLPTIHTP